MIKNEIKHMMLHSGFTFVKTTKSYPGSRGDEDVFTRKPDFKYTFRVSKVDKDNPDYGLYVGIGSQFEEIDSIVKHDIDVAETWSSNKPLPMWTGENLKRLLSYFQSKTPSADRHTRSKEGAEELITVVLPMINNG